MLEAAEHLEQSNAVNVEKAVKLENEKDEMLDQIARLEEEN